MLTKIGRKWSEFTRGEWLEWMCGFHTSQHSKSRAKRTPWWYRCQAFSTSTAFYHVCCTWVHNLLRYWGGTDGGMECGGLRNELLMNIICLPVTHTLIQDLDLVGHCVGRGGTGGEEEVSGNWFSISSLWNVSNVLRTVGSALGCAVPLLTWA